MKIDIRNLLPGMILDENIYANELSTVSLMNKGTTINDKHIMALRKAGIETVKVTIKSSVIDTVNEITEEKAIEGIKEVIYSNKVQTLNEAIFELVSSISKTDFLSFDISKFTIAKTDTYQHSVNTAKFAIALGKAYNEKVGNYGEMIDLKELATAALLHDIGTKCSDKKILSKIKSSSSNALTKYPGYDETCFDVYNPNMKCVYGYTMLRDSRNISATVKKAILMHEENSIGTGPLRLILIGNDISKIMANIIQVCSFYEKLFDKSLKRGFDAYKIKTAMQRIRRDGVVDSELSKLFMESIPLFSKGLRVMLSNGEIAIVTKINPDDIDRPVVQTVRTDQIIDLSVNLGLAIYKICDFNLNIQAMNNDLNEKKR